ncbi:hypothetical protein P3T23_000479 [Paraburkholderia sp. GAS448]
MAVSAAGGIARAIATELHDLLGIGFDKSNNLYIAQNNFGPRPFGSGYTGDGAVLESYRFGTRSLNWHLYGLTFVDSAAFDPASPNDVYTGSKHFTLEL